MAVPREGKAPLVPKVALESLVTRDTPPAFIVHAADDPSVPVERSWALFSALKAAHVPVELHIFEAGGHGFGIRLARGKPIEAWPDLFVRWGERHHFFGSGQARAGAPGAGRPAGEGSSRGDAPHH
jgi:acetyl esterase/lipase